MDPRTLKTQLTFEVWQEFCIIFRDVNVFIFQKNDRFVMKTTTKNRKQNYHFFKKFVFKNGRL